MQEKRDGSVFSRNFRWKSRNDVCLSVRGFYSVCILYIYIGGFLGPLSAALLTFSSATTTLYEASASIVLYLYTHISDMFSVEAERRFGKLGRCGLYYPSRSGCRQAKSFFFFLF